MIVSSVELEWFVVEKFFRIDEGVIFVDCVGELLPFSEYVTGEL